MELVQSRIVTEDVGRLATFYARLVGCEVVVNDYYVEIPTPCARIGLSRVRFTEFQEGCGPPAGVAAGEVIADFAVGDVDRAARRIEALGAECVLRPTLQPWGRRSAMFRDPEGHLINLFSKAKEEGAS